MSQALRAAGVQAFPDDPAAFSALATGVLREMVLDRLGEDAAAAIMTDLGPAFVSEVTAPDSGVRPRQTRPTPTPPPPRPDGTVLLGASSPHELSVLRAAVEPLAEVEAATDVFGLLQLAKRFAGESVTVVLRDDMRAMERSSVRNLGRILGPQARVVLWGPAGVEPADADDLEWTHLGPLEATEVAHLTVSMLGRPEPLAPTAPAGPRTGVLQVLLVEPHEALRGYLASRLRHCGYEVVEASDGFEALDRCAHLTPSAVVSAFELPSLAGGQLSELLGSRYGEHAPPVLMLADPPLPSPPAGTTAVLPRGGPAEDVLAELASWIG